MVFLEAAAPIAGFLALAAERLLKAYQTILDIRLKRQALKENMVPDDALEAIDEHVNGRMKQEIEEIVKMLISESKVENTHS